MKVGLIVQEPVLRASVRDPSGDVTAAAAVAASAGVNRRTKEGLVPLPRESIAELGQMSRIATAVGALMVTVKPSPA